MTITDHDGLDELCSALGIATEYQDIWGTMRIPDVDTKRDLLEALGSPLVSDADIHDQLEKLAAREWQQIVTPLMVHRQNNSPLRIRLTLTPTQATLTTHWELREESGQIHQGEWQTHPDNLIGKHRIDATWLQQYQVELPAIGSTGYHSLRITTADNIETHTTLIIAPDTCYQPAALKEQQKLWGISLQLYALRSRRNWGIGDFTDLKSIIEILAPLGLDIIGLNPLHSLFLHQPDKASPYSPSSRNLLNPIYLDVEAIAEYKHDEKYRRLVHDPEFQSRLQQLREQELINYNKVWAMKLQVLKNLYQDFRDSHLATNSERAIEFRRFETGGGEDLFKFGLFEALQNHFYALDNSCYSWQQWPQEYRDPESETCALWAQKNIAAIEFHLYLQWHCELQLSETQDCCRTHGMVVGLYRDLAVGESKTAAQCWADQRLYALDMNIGAPPDDFNLTGQNWALPPVKPGTLNERNYQPFVNTLRANMRHAGALRIDHIMGLMRLFWVPPDSSPVQGTYVSYPFEDLLGILALESQRNHCLIIGEDLGTVADEVRHRLEINKILSYRIFCFEKDWHHGNYRAPGEYPRNALCTAGSHDLPSLKSFWQGSDLDLREKLKLFPSDEIKHQQWKNRRQDRQQILAALQQAELISAQDIEAAELETGFSPALALSIQRYLARSNAAVMMIQLEDLLLQDGQVNVPGTIDEYPNWRCKIAFDLEDWSQQIDLEGIALAINSERTD